MRPFPEAFPSSWPFPRRRHPGRPLRRTFAAAGAGLVVLGTAVGVASPAAADPPAADSPTGTFYVTEDASGGEAANTGEVVAIPVTDGVFGTPRTLASGLPTLASVTATSDTVYAVGRGGNGTVWSIPAAGGDARKISDILYPSDIAVSGDTLYVAGSAPGDYGQISTIPTAGGDPTLLAGLGHRSSSPGITASGQTLYVAIPYAEQSGIVSVPMSGGAVDRVADAQNARSITTDDATLFWRNDAGNLSSVPITGGNSTPLATEAGMRDLVAVGDNVYAAVHTGSIVAIPKTGGDPVTVVEGLHSPEGIAYVSSEEPCPGPTGSLEEFFGSVAGSVASSIPGQRTSCGGAGGSAVGSMVAGGAGSHVGS